MGDILTPDQQDDAPATAAKQGKGSDATAKTVTINRPRQDIYDFWRDFSNLAQVMDNVVSIETMDHRRSHWMVKAPGGSTVEWTSRVTEDRPGELIAWMSEEGADRSEEHTSERV